MTVFRILLFNRFDALWFVGLEYNVTSGIYVWADGSENTYSGTVLNPGKCIYWTPDWLWWIDATKDNGYLDTQECSKRMLYLCECKYKLFNFQYCKVLSIRGV